MLSALKKKLAKLKRRLLNCECSPAFNHISRSVYPKTITTMVSALYDPSIVPEGYIRESLARDVNATPPCALAFDVENDPSLYGGEVRMTCRATWEVKDILRSSEEITVYTYNGDGTRRLNSSIETQLTSQYAPS